MTHNKTQELYRRDEAIWLMYTRASWKMEEIAEVFKCSRANIHRILLRVAHRKGEELDAYEK